jgi:hypothetical protein
MEKLLYALQQTRDKRKQASFQKWLEKKTDTDEDALSNKDVVVNYLTEIRVYLKHNNYKIKNDKQFKDDIASYIYNNSY